MLVREYEIMTRSKRKTPKLAITCVESEKDDKRIAARRECARITSKLSVHAASEPDFDLSEFCRHPREGQWVFSKDGKYHAGSKLSADDIKRRGVMALCIPAQAVEEVFNWLLTPKS